jgi:hypothetical protein
MMQQLGSDRRFLAFSFPNTLRAWNCSSSIMADQSSNSKLYSQKTEEKVEINKTSKEN